VFFQEFILSRGVALNIKLVEQSSTQSQVEKMGANSIMTTIHLKTGVKPTSKMSCISNVPKTMDVKHNIGVMKQPLLQTSIDTESLQDDLPFLP
jgi:hypothetical protein